MGAVSSLSLPTIGSSERVSLLIPLTILIQARYKNKHITWCRAQFTDYQLFTSRVKIVANGYVQSLQP